MVRILTILSVSTILACSSNATFGVNNEKKYSQHLDLESIKIMHNGDFSGKISSDESIETCKKFVLSESDVLIFFTTTRSATLREYEHDLNASNCYASGTFVSKSGASGEWKIDRSRRGFLYTQNGEPEYFYCGECNNPLFYEPCDIDCVHGE